MEARKIDFYQNVQLQSEYYRNLPSYNFAQFSTAFILKHKRGTYQKAFLSAVIHFTEFQSSINEIFETKYISKEILDEFICYLHVEKKLSLGSIQGIIIKIKYLLKKAYMNGWAVDESYSEAKVRQEDLFFVYLSKTEIVRIYYFNDLTKDQKEIRDLFIVGCMTGLRYSDCSRLTKENIKADTIQILTKKTRSKACAPMSFFIEEVLERYNNKMPPARCIQYFNKAIKEICRKVGLTEEINFEKEKAGNIVAVSMPKYMLISSHTARRSFITNMIKENVAENKIMKCTSHKSSQSLARYNRMTLEENAKSLLSNNFFN